MDPSEVEFLAEKELVKIIPNFSLDKIYLIGVSTVIFAHQPRLFEVFCLNGTVGEMIDDSRLVVCFHKSLM